MAILTSFFFLFCLYSFRRSEKKATNWMINQKRFPTTASILALLLLCFSGCIFFTFPAYAQHVNAHVSAARVKPNPAIDIIELIVDTSFINLSFQVVSEDGKVQHQDFINEERTLIPIAFLSKGVYYIFIEKGNLPIRFIKQ